MKALHGALLETRFAAQGARVTPVQDEEDDCLLGCRENPGEPLTLLELVKPCQEAALRNSPSDQRTGSSPAGPPLSAATTIPPPWVKREMRTTVSIPDRHARRIGGVISDSTQKTRERVPWLAGPPLIGALSRHDSDTGSRPTPCFLVTPHIPHDPDLDDVSGIGYRETLSAAQITGMDRARTSGPAPGVSQSAMDLGAFQLPRHRPTERGALDPEELGLDPLRREVLLRGAAPPARDEVPRDAEGAPGSGPR